MVSPIKILHLEDSPADARLVGNELLKYYHNFDIQVVDSKQDFIDALEKFSPDIILSEYTTSSLSTIGALEILNKLDQPVPFILVTSSATHELALSMIQLGADDYIMKEGLNKLPLTVFNVLEKYRMQGEWKRLTREIREKQRMADEAISISIERYELVAKATSDMVWDWNIQTGEIYRSKEGWKRLFSASDYNTPTSPDAWIARIHPEDRNRIKDFEASLLDPNSITVFEIECRILNYNNDYIHVEDKGYVIRNEKGRAVRIVGVTKNITDARIAQELIKSSEERYRYLFENSPAAMIIWDIDTLSIIDVNDTATKIYGYSKEEFCNLTILDIRKQEEYEKFKGLVERLKIDPDLHNAGIWKHLTKNGSEIFMDIASHKLYLNGRTVVMAMANNVTEKVLLQQNIEKINTIKQKEITDAVITAQEKERELIGSELHDNVNQILATSLLYLGIIRKNSTNTATLDETEQLINSAIQEIRNLTHSMIAPSLEEASLQNALENIIKVTRLNSSFIIHTSLACGNETDIPEKLKLSIYRIVQEQFNNIQKYAGANNVFVSLECNDQQISLSIKDDGTGFDTSKKSEGVGLMNIKTRASLYNGKVSIQSSPGNGCELCIVFDKQYN